MVITVIINAPAFVCCCDDGVLGVRYLNQS